MGAISGGSGEAEINGRKYKVHDWKIICPVEQPNNPPLAFEVISGELWFYYENPNDRPYPPPISEN
jgi:hypothetical protein